MDCCNWRSSKASQDLTLLGRGHPFPDANNEQLDLHWNESSGDSNPITCDGCQAALHLHLFEKTAFKPFERGTPLAPRWVVNMAAQHSRRMHKSFLHHPFICAAWGWDAPGTYISCTFCSLQVIAAVQTTQRRLCAARISVKKE